MNLQEYNGQTQTELFWLETGTSGVLLWRRLWTFGLRKMRGLA